MKSNEIKIQNLKLRGDLTNCVSSGKTIMKYYENDVFGPT